MRSERRGRAEWHRLVTAWLESGLSAEAFASQQRPTVSARNLSAWARKLKLRVPAETGPLEFVELASSTIRRKSRITIRLRSGVHIEMPEGSSAAEVAALVRSLAS